MGADAILVQPCGAKRVEPACVLLSGRECGAVAAGLTSTANRMEEGSTVAPAAPLVLPVDVSGQVTLLYTSPG
jgi:hypothetical protein